MNYKKIQELINNTDYWDSRVEQLECNYFSDRVKLSFKDGDSLVMIEFEGCYKVVFDHVKSYEKNMAVKHMDFAQIPYFLTNINIKETCEENVDFFVCNITMFPLYVEIWCKEIKIQNSTGK